MTRSHAGIVDLRPALRGSSMVKVLWFLKRAPHLSPTEFRAWWENHARDIVAHQGPYLSRYVVNFRIPDEQFAGKAAPSEWDGVAEQWFPDMASYNAWYGRPDSPTRSDTMAHTSRLERLVVEEVEMFVASDGKLK